MPPLHRPAVGFAHRGAPRPGIRENTLRAFRQALVRGASGLESDVWLTADGVPVLHHKGALGWWRWRHAVCHRRADELPGWLPRLSELYEACGTAYELSLDIKDSAAAGPTLTAARLAGGEASSRLWLCGRLFDLRAWRGLDPEVHLVESTDVRALPGGAADADRHAAALQAAGVDALNLRADEWTAEIADALHRHGRLAFGWDAQTRRVLDGLLGLGLDGVYSDHVDRMLAAITAASGARPVQPGG